MTIRSNIISARQTWLQMPYLEPETPLGTFLVLLFLCFTFLQKLKQQVSNDPSFLALWQASLDDPATYPYYIITQDFIMKGGRIWLPQGSPFIPTLLMDFHSSPTGGHMGIAKTLTQISENFSWSGIKKDVKHFVVVCVDYQHTKYETKKTVGLLCPLPILFWPWENLSLDFTMGLPAYHDYTTIPMVMDCFSKGIHLGMLPPHCTSHTVVLLFMDIVKKLHGMPISLILDRNPLFISQLWQELFRLSWTKLHMSSAYHP